MQPEYIKIPLTKGYEALIDAEDADRVLAFKWHTIGPSYGNVYAQTSLKAGGKRSAVMMHRLVMDAQDGQMVDHKNGIGIDNRKSNLRFASPSQNSMNLHTIRGLSPYRGVSWSKRYEKWQCSISKEGRRIFIGRYSDEVEAAMAYDRVAIEIHGEFAAINFPKDGQNGCRE